MVKMRMCAVLIGFAAVGMVSAALPPQYQNAKDLDVMVDFINAHPAVAGTLVSVDLANYTVHFGEGCEARFGRKSVFHLPGWVGPAEPLEFKHSSCELE